MYAGELSYIMCLQTGNYKTIIATKDEYYAIKGTCRWNERSARRSKLNPYNIYWLKAI